MELPPSFESMTFCCDCKLQIHNHTRDSSINYEGTGAIFHITVPAVFESVRVLVYFFPHMDPDKN